MRPETASGRSALRKEIAQCVGCGGALRVGVATAASIPRGAAQQAMHGTLRRSSAERGRGWRTAREVRRGGDRSAGSWSARGGTGGCASTSTRARKDSAVLRPSSDLVSCRTAHFDRV